MKSSIFLALIVLSFCASAGYAAPFCVQKQGMPDDCSYYDATQCRQRSQQEGGVCSVNTSEIRLQPGTGNYCLVDSKHISMCQYADRTSCDNDAARYNAVCVEFPANQVQPNPYKLDPNSKY